MIPNVEKRVIFTLPRQELWEKGCAVYAEPGPLGVLHGWRPAGQSDDKRYQRPVALLASESGREADRCILDRDFKDMVSEGLKVDDMEGKHCIEVWIYHPRMFPDTEYVDKLSLYLSLRHDTDARVEGELEYIIKTIKW